MGLFAGPAGWTVTAGQAAADVILGSPGADSDGAVEDADSVREGRNRAVSGAGNYAVASLLDTANNLGVAGVSEEDVREQWVARGAVRDVIDTTFEYDGEWGGVEDTADLVGPSAWGGDDSALDTVSDAVTVDEDGTDPTSGWQFKAALGGVALLVVLWLVRPLLEIGAGVTE